MDSPPLSGPSTSQPAGPPRGAAAHRIGKVLRFVIVGAGVLVVICAAALVSVGWYLQPLVREHGALTPPALAGLMDAAAADGARAGRTVDEVGCVAAAERRLPRGGSATQPEAFAAFTAACLRRSSPTPGFCTAALNGVPMRPSPAARCGEALSACIMIDATVRAFCARPESRTAAGEHGGGRTDSPTPAGER